MAKTDGQRQLCCLEDHAVHHHRLFPVHRVLPVPQPYPIKRVIVHLATHEADTAIRPVQRHHHRVVFLLVPAVLRELFG